VFQSALIVVLLLCAISPASHAQIAPDPQAVEEVAAGKRTVANAAWWGFDPVDSTLFLQAAINNTASTVTIPKYSDWHEALHHHCSNTYYAIRETIKEESV
jgi:hypothetical protein